MVQYVEPGAQRVLPCSLVEPLGVTLLAQAILSGGVLTLGARLPAARDLLDRVWGSSFGRTGLIAGAVFVPCAALFAFRLGMGNSLEINEYGELTIPDGMPLGNLTVRGSRFAEVETLLVDACISGPEALQDLNSFVSRCTGLTYLHLPRVNASLQWFEVPHTVKEVGFTLNEDSSEDDLLSHLRDWEFTGTVSLKSSNEDDLRQDQQELLTWLQTLMRADAIAYRCLHKIRLITNLYDKDAIDSFIEAIGPVKDTVNSADSSKRIIQIGILQDKDIEYLVDRLLLVEKAEEIVIPESEAIELKEGQDRVVQELDFEPARFEWRSCGVKIVLTSEQMEVVQAKLARCRPDDVYDALPSDGHPLGESPFVVSEK